MKSYGLSAYAFLFNHSFQEVQFEYIIFQWKYYGKFHNGMIHSVDNIGFYAIFIVSIQMICTLCGCYLGQQISPMCYCYQGVTSADNSNTFPCSSSANQFVIYSNTETISVGLQIYYCISLEYILTRGTLDFKQH